MAQGVAAADLFTIRNERQLMEQPNYNLMDRWFVWLHMDSPVWDATVYSKNRERLPNGDIARKFFNEVLKTARRNDVISKEHFTSDATPIEAWAGQKGFKPKDDSERMGPPGGGVAPEIGEAVQKVVSAHAGKGRNNTADFRGRSARTPPTRRRTERLGWMFTPVAAAYNPVRTPTLLAKQALEPCPA